MTHICVTRDVTTKLNFLQLNFYRNCYYIILSNSFIIFSHESSFPHTFTFHSHDNTHNTHTMGNSISTRSFIPREAAECFNRENQLDIELYWLYRRSLLSQTQDSNDITNQIVDDCIRLAAEEMEYARKHQTKIELFY